MLDRTGSLISLRALLVAPATVLKISAPNEVKFPNGERLIPLMKLKILFDQVLVTED